MGVVVPLFLSLVQALEFHRGAKLLPKRRGIRTLSGSSEGDGCPKLLKTLLVRTPKTTNGHQPTSVVCDTPELTRFASSVCLKTSLERQSKSPPESRGGGWNPILSLCLLGLCFSVFKDKGGLATTRFACS